jgi:hypothetical protein
MREVKDAVLTFNIKQNWLLSKAEFNIYDTKMETRTYEFEYDTTNRKTPMPSKVSIYIQVKQDQRKQVLAMQYNVSSEFRKPKQEEFSIYQFGFEELNFK